MEISKIKNFLEINGSGEGEGYGYGSGEGYGYVTGEGYGSGSGEGEGSGSGEGYGYGSGDGYGYGSGEGYGSVYGSGDGEGYVSGEGIKIIKHENELVFYVDEIPTIFKSIIGNYAKCGIVSTNDFTKKNCYVAKFNNCFAHERTLKKSQESARKKYFSTLNIEDKIEQFVKKFAKDKAYSGNEFFEWHNILTGSCEFGRNEFVKNHKLSLETEYTVKEFINLCKNDFGGEIIKQLTKFYN